MIRESGYFSNPLEVSVRESLNESIPLSDRLYCFSEIAQQNYEHFVEAKESDTDYVHTPIYVSNEEQEHHEKIENCTKKEIEKQAFDVVSEFDTTKQLYFKEYFQKEVGNKRKICVRQFLL